ncbi:MAG: PIN domain-containing protein [Roseiflexus sp.]
MPAQRNYILIDYENVQPDLTLLLAETNIYVIVFVGAVQKSVPADFAAAMQRLGSRALYVILSGNGSNALDFHIAFYPGVLAVRDHAAYFHIIPKDAGFDPLIQHLRAKRVNAYRFPDVIDIPNHEKGSFHFSPVRIAA